MERRIKLYMCLFLLRVWCSLDAGGPFLVVEGATVSAWIVTPEDGLMREGELVHMTCIATGLRYYHVVEWRRREPAEGTLRWGTVTTTTNERFVFHTENSRANNALIVQDFTVTNLHRVDQGEYACSVKDILANPASEAAATAPITLEVLYFPSKPFPICSPAGPISVDTGTELHIQCSSEGGNPVIHMGVSQTPEMPIENAWTSLTVNGTVRMSLDTTTEVADGGTEFMCTISSASFPGKRRSCTIGPVSVVRHPTDPISPRPSQATRRQLMMLTSLHVSETTTGLAGPLSLPNASSPQPTLPKDSPAPYVPWIAAFVVSVVLLAAMVTFIFILVVCVIKPLRRRSQNFPNLKETAPPFPRPLTLTELQTQNNETIERTEQPIYFQTVEAEF